MMNFLNIECAVGTCVLSTRWKDLWKRLTNLTFNFGKFNSYFLFSKVVSSVLSSRDGSISLHNVVLSRRCSADPFIDPGVLHKLIKYAVSHGVQQLTLDINVNIFPYSMPCLFSSQSLTFLMLCAWCWESLLPKSLGFTALKVLHLQNVIFSTSENGCAEPFSTCNMLTTLFIDSCALQNKGKVLCITNSKLSSLTLSHRFFIYPFKVALCTPNLSSFTTRSYPIFELISSVCDLPFLGEVSIDVPTYYRYMNFRKKYPLLINWLQVLTNVTILTFSPQTLEILDVLSSTASMRTEPPCFVRLKSVKLKVNLGSYSTKFDEKVKRIVEYLLLNSPPARVDIIMDA